VYTYDRFGPPNDVVTLSVHDNGGSPKTYSFCTTPQGTDTATAFIQTGTGMACTSFP
jgi:hypothetical protein